MVYAIHGGIFSDTVYQSTKTVYDMALNTKERIYIHVKINDTVFFLSIH